MLQRSDDISFDRWDFFLNGPMSGHGWTLVLERPNQAGFSREFKGLCRCLRGHSARPLGKSMFAYFVTINVIIVMKEYVVWYFLYYQLDLAPLFDCQAGGLFHPGTSSVLSSRGSSKLISFKRCVQEKTPRNIISLLLSFPPISENV